MRWVSPAFNTPARAARWEDLRSDPNEGNVESESLILLLDLLDYDLTNLVSTEP